MDKLIYSKDPLAQSTSISAILHLALALILFSKPLHIYLSPSLQVGKQASILQNEENRILFKQNRALAEAFVSFEKTRLRPIFSPSEIAKILHAERLPRLESSHLLPKFVLSFPEIDIDSIIAASTCSLSQESDLSFSLKSFDFSPSIEDPAISSNTRDSALDYSKNCLPLSIGQEISGFSEAIPLKEDRYLMQKPLLKMAVPEMYDRLNFLPGALNVVSISKEKEVNPSFKASNLMMKSSQPAMINQQDRILELAAYGLPSFNLKEWNQLFDFDVKTYPQEKGGFLFSISLNPKQGLSDYRLKQNFLFIIDRSNSVDKHRYQTFKRAVVRAVGALREGDAFNVLLLDSSITRFSEKALPFNQLNQKSLEDFLEKEQYGHYKAATDIYSVLRKMLDSIDYSEEAMTAILISDGDSSLKSNQQRKKIKEWLEANQDRITLYTATAGEGNNLSSLKMLSLASRGSLLYSDTYAAFPRKLAKLVMDLRFPVAKEMSFSLTFSDPLACIEMFPPSTRLPYLFSDHPYVLIGSCNKLTDFSLMLEGKNKEHILTIKKYISLSKAKQGSRILFKQWTSEKAHTFFDQYLLEGESLLLEEAKKYDTQNSQR